MKKAMAGFVAAVSVLALTACGDDEPNTAPSTEAPMAESTEAPMGTEVPMTEAPSDLGDIVEVASAAGSFSTLVAAVQAAGLVETLQGEGPFTVFAPTDEAFAALPAGLVDKLLLPENKDLLVKILTFHVLPGKVLAADVVEGEVATVEGQNLLFAFKPDLVVGNAPFTSFANVVTADVMASNGVIHVIDTVLLPPDVDPSTL